MTTVTTLVESDAASALEAKPGEYLYGVNSDTRSRTADVHVVTCKTDHGAGGVSFSLYHSQSHKRYRVAMHTTVEWDNDAVMSYQLLGDHTQQELATCSLIARELENMGHDMQPKRYGAKKFEAIAKDFCEYVVREFDTLMAPFTD